MKACLYYPEIRIILKCCSRAMMADVNEDYSLVTICTREIRRKCRTVERKIEGEVRDCEEHVTKGGEDD